MTKIPSLKGFIPVGPWALVMVEPLESRTKSGLILVHSDYDDKMSPGIGVVLAAPKTYRYLPYSERGKNKTADLSERTQTYPVEFAAGDRVLFRRFLRDANKKDARDLSLLSELASEYPDHEFSFLHVEDVMAIIEEE